MKDLRKQSELMIDSGGMILNYSNQIIDSRGGSRVYIPDDRIFYIHKHYDAGGFYIKAPIYSKAGMVLLGFHIEANGLSYVGGIPNYEEGLVIASDVNLTDPIRNGYGYRPVRLTLRGDQRLKGITDLRLISGSVNNHSTLEMDSASQHFQKLRIEGVDSIVMFNGGSLSDPKYLTVDELSFRDSSSVFKVQGWRDQQTYILVKRNSAGLVGLLPQIKFNGYGSTRLVDYNSDYWQITPLPELGCYGAVLGGVGLAIWGLGRRRRRGALNSNR